MFKIFVITVISILLTQYGFNKINDTKISSYRSKSITNKLDNFPNCEDVPEKIDCYYNFNNMNDLEVEIYLYKERCDMTQEIYENYIDHLFFKYNISNILIDYLFTSDYSILSSHYQYFLNIGCHDYDKVIYAKNKYENSVKEELIQKSYLYQTFYYLIIGLIQNLNIFNMLFKIVSVLTLGFINYIY